MIWAIKDRKRVSAYPKGKAICPICNQQVIAKCGEIKIWHWAHKKDNECDSFKEPETKWHLDWKNEFPNKNQEVIIGNHRADVKTNKGIVIEFQNSPINKEKIIEREDYYKEMIWVLNGKTIGKGIILKKKEGFFTFRWKNPPKSWFFSKKPKYIDFRDIQKEKWKHIEENDYMGYDERWIKTQEKVSREIFLIKKIYNKIPCRGWGKMLTKEEFINQFK